MMTNENPVITRSEAAGQVGPKQEAPVTVATPAAADIPDVEYISLDELLPRVKQFAAEGARLITLTCCDTGGGFEVLYHFDQGLRMRHLSVNVPTGSKLPSISSVYLCAFLVENEIRDLFGLEVEGVAIDFKGRLVLTGDSPASPLLKRKAASEGA